VVSMRKALFIATWGLSGLVLKDDSKQERAAKATERQARPRKQAKVARPRQRTARRPTSQAARRTKPAAPQMAGTSAVTQEAGFGRGTLNELERLAILHGSGALTNEEFSRAKAKILGTGQAPHQSNAGPATFPAITANVAAARHLTGSAVHDRGTPIATEMGG
jgi:hypothetical protein